MENKRTYDSPSAEIIEMRIEAFFCVSTQYGTENYNHAGLDEND